MRRIYLASSWRNPEQPELVAALRGAGHDVYDFLNPAPGNTGFAWSAVAEDWRDWTPEGFAAILRTSPIAAAGFEFDRDALDACDTCVLLLPCGRSAHLELGYAAGQGKDTFVLLRADRFEPELMYLLCSGMATTVPALLTLLSPPDPPAAEIIDLMAALKASLAKGPK